MTTETSPATAAEPIRRQNRWALSALVRRHTDTTSGFAMDLGSSHSTVFDALSGRRDVSPELLGRMADTLGEDVRAISADPYGIVAPLMKVAASARKLLPDLDGDDMGLRDALAALDVVLGGDA